MKVEKATMICLPRLHRREVRCGSRDETVPKFFVREQVKVRFRLELQ